MTVRIALLGLGEAGSEIARDLVAARRRRARLRPEGRRSADGVPPASSEADAVGDADVVLSANSSHDAMTGAGQRPARRCAPAPSGPTSTPPRRGLKERAGRRCGRPGRAGGRRRAHVAGARQRACARRCWCPGRAADRYAEILAGLGADVDGPAGHRRATAISRKLLRSVFYKGLAAAVVEALRGAEAAGCADWLRGNIAPSWRASTSTPSTGWSTARTRTPGAGPTRWPPPPSSWPSSASRPGSPPPPATSCTEIRDRAHA